MNIEEVKLAFKRRTPILHKAPMYTTRYKHINAIIYRYPGNYSCELQSESGNSVTIAAIEEIEADLKT